MEVIQRTPVLALLRKVELIEECNGHTAIINPVREMEDKGLKALLYNACTISYHTDGQGKWRGSHGTGISESCVKHVKFLIHFILFYPFLPHDAFV